ncbi:UNKNOWN [Stylonychia lemnae]|uniref:Uncharacterized protein n=1 Tax=Stylonychia lemnae TaxID=5949 RepID=A0A078BBK5_STYLE|nr:UNKNOWN [Stylonychia lemnae]|eukprot:CDW91596.1 UNKNOWN [Stylonychia lemnae]
MRAFCPNRSQSKVPFSQNNAYHRKSRSVGTSKRNRSQGQSINIQIQRQKDKFQNQSCELKSMIRKTEYQQRSFSSNIRRKPTINFDFDLIGLFVNPLVKNFVLQACFLKNLQSLTSEQAQQLAVLLTLYNPIVQNLYEFMDIKARVLGAFINDLKYYQLSLSEEIDELKIQISVVQGVIKEKEKIKQEIRKIEDEFYLVFDYFLSADNLITLIDYNQLNFNFRDYIHLNAQKKHFKECLKIVSDLYKSYEHPLYFEKEKTCNRYLNKKIGMEIVIRDQVTFKTIPDSMLINSETSNDIKYVVKDHKNGNQFTKNIQILNGENNQEDQDDQSKIIK